MKRNIKFAAVLILCLTVIGVFGQTKPTPKPDAISEVLKAEGDAQSAFDAAKARLEAAQANTRAVLFREMGEQGVKPSECVVDNNPFACISRDQATGAWSFKKLKTEAAQVKPKE
jgi:hypothetical protein